MRARYVDLQNPEERRRDWDGIRIGSESCAQLLPGIEELSDISAGIDPGRLTLVTPIAGPDDLDSTLRLIDVVLAAGFGEIVVNDWGILRKMAGRKNANVTAGRLLLRLRRGPGTADHWNTLDDASRRYFAWGPLLDGPFLDFLHRHGVNRLEVDRPRHWIPPPPVSGTRISFHCDTRLIAISGACPWLYQARSGQWQKEKGCGRKCAVSGDLVMEAPLAPRPLIMRGKAILERIGELVREEELPEAVDRIILDREDRDREGD